MPCRPGRGRQLGTGAAPNAHFVAQLHRLLELKPTAPAPGASSRLRRGRVGLERLKLDVRYVGEQNSLVVLAFLLSGPGREHFRVPSGRRYQFRMRSHLDYSAVVDDDDPVGAHGCRQPVRDEDRGPAFEQAVEGALDLGLGLEIQIGSSFVQDQHPRRGTKARASAISCLSPEESDWPRSCTWVSRPRGSLSTRSVRPMASTASSTCRWLASGLANTTLSLNTGPVKKEGFLGHDAELAPQRGDGYVGQVVTVDSDPAPVGS